MLIDAYLLVYLVTISCNCKIHTKNILRWQQHFAPYTREKDLQEKRNAIEREKNIQSA